jgi:hypothetical protein
LWSVVDSAVPVTNLAFPDADLANLLDDLAVLQDDLALRATVGTGAAAESAVLEANFALPITIVAWSGVDSAVLETNLAFPSADISNSRGLAALRSCALTRLHTSSTEDDSCIAEPSPVPADVQQAA